MPETDEKQLSIPQAHRWFAVECNNGAWDLIEKEGRTREENHQMISMAYAAKYHWSNVPGATPENEVRANNLISRTYSAMGASEPAKVFAQLCIEGCTTHGIADWDLASVYGAMAYAHQAAGDEAGKSEWRTKANAACAAIKDEEDRKIVEEDLAKLG